MKSEYRGLVEAIISDERKLAEAMNLHTDALERFQKASETLVIISKRLESKRVELNRMDALLDRARPASGGGGKTASCDSALAADSAELRELRADVKSLQASVQMLARDSLRTTA